MPNDVDLIKSRLDIVEVIGEYVKLKQSGQNWKGLCPFHGEKTPSFMVHREKQIWRCFGCGLGGDIFSFVQRLENLEFPEALELLARKAGVELTRSPGAASAESARGKLFRILEQAQTYYQEQLTKSELAQVVRAYVASRAITPESVTTFGLGYALPEWDKLTVNLRNQGFSQAELMASGLTIKSERGPGAYDRFRDRLLFPIADTQGRVVGFGGRTLDPVAKEAKYINSPQTAVYNKSLILYNLDRAKQAIREAGFAVLVEGYMDVIGSWQAGVKHVVATSGTALTQEQVQLLKRYTGELRIAFDADLAGQSASERGIDLALQAEFEVKVIQLPQGKDPDECARANPVAWREAVAQALPIGDYAFARVLGQVDPRTREGKKEAARKLLVAIAKLPDPVERDYYVKRLARELDVDERSLREGLSTRVAVTPPAILPAAATVTSPAPPRVELLAGSLLALACKFPEHLPALLGVLLPEMVAGATLERLYRQLLVYYTERHHIDLEEFRLELAGEPELGELLATLQLQAEHQFYDLTPGEALKEITRLTRDLKTAFTKGELKQLSAAISEAEHAGKKPDPVLLERFTELSRELAQLDH